MTSPEFTNPNSFPAEYALPADQLGAEMTLRDSYAAQFPEYAVLLTHNLQELQRQAGINIPKYRASEQDREASDAAGLNDELGYANFGTGPVSEGGFATLLVEMPATGDMTPEKFEQLSPEEQLVAEATRDGMRAVDMPAHTRAMVEGMYALTGASVIRDERAEGAIRGNIVRKGMYMDSEVYFSEDYNDQSFVNGKPTFGLRIIGKRLAEESVEGLSESQLQIFVRESGLEVEKVPQFITENGVNKHNYKAVAGVIKATRGTIDLTPYMDENGVINRTPWSD